MLLYGNAVSGHCDKALDAVEKFLAGREYLVGSRDSLVDISLCAYTRATGEGGFDLNRYPAISAWSKRLAVQPGHNAIAA